MNDSTRLTMRYCCYCGGPVVERIPAGDSLPRMVCDACDIVHYRNPRVIVGTLPLWKDQRVLMCKRAIEPRLGFWTIPCGFLENGETTEEGAIRETQEEAHANVRITNLHSVYSIPHINQVYLVYRAELLDLNFSAGEESLEVRLYERDEINWSEIAFSSVRFALESYYTDLDARTVRTHNGKFIPDY